MTTLFVFLQIQLLASFVVAVALWRCMRQSVQPIIAKNSTRLDGTFSRQRQLIEFQALKHAGFSIVSALLLLFAFTVLFGMVIVGISCTQFEWPDVAAPIPALFSTTLDAAMVDFLNKWQWQLLTTYVVISFFFFTPYVRYVYQRALENYRTRANVRYLKYYQQEWWDDSKVATKKQARGLRLSPVGTGPANQATH